MMVRNHSTKAAKIIILYMIRKATMEGINQTAVCHTKNHLYMIQIKMEEYPVVRVASMVVTRNSPVMVLEQIDLEIISQ